MNESFQLVCPNCGQRNRIAAGRPARQATCGACKSELFAGRPLDVDSRRFRRHLERDGVPIVVDFWAPWCSPCKAMAPAFSQVAESLEPRARFLKVNVDLEQDLAASLGIQGIPAVYVFWKGKVVASQAGAMNAAALRAWIQQALPVSAI